MRFGQSCPSGEKPGNGRWSPTRGSSATVVALPIAAAVPVSSPSIANEASPDQALIELGKAFDAGVARWNWCNLKSEEVEDEAELRALDDAQMKSLPDEIFYSIGRARTHTTEGYLVKARAIAFACTTFWDKPFDDLDWDLKTSACLSRAFSKRPARQLSKTT